MVVKNQIIPVNPVTAVTSGAGSLFDAWKEYSCVKELEITKREQIAANREVALSSIKEQADMLRDLIKSTFAERSRNFDKYFSMLENGFVNGNDQQINAALTLIVEQTKINPMMQAAQIVNKINDPNDRDIIEI